MALLFRRLCRSSYGFLCPSVLVRAESCEKEGAHLLAAGRAHHSCSLASSVSLAFACHRFLLCVLPQVDVGVYTDRTPTQPAPAGNSSCVQVRPPLHKLANAGLAEQHIS